MREERREGRVGKGKVPKEWGAKRGAVNSMQGSGRSREVGVKSKALFFTGTHSLTF